MPTAIAQHEPTTNTRGIADHLHMHPCTVGRLRDQGKIPFIRVNARTFRYRISEVEKALKK